MKIEKRESSKMVMIKTLESGEVFLFEDRYFIVTDIDAPSGCVVTVDIGDGAETFFTEEKLVLPVNGTFMID